MWLVPLWIMNPSCPSPYLSLPIILLQVHFGFICPKNLVPEMSRLFKRFCNKMIPVAFHLDENHLYLHSRKLFLILKTPTARVSSSWIDGEKELFFTKKKILQSYALDYFHFVQFANAFFLFTNVPNF